jgi:hypothetical protein
MREPTFTACPQELFFEVLWAILAERLAPGNMIPTRIEGSINFLLRNWYSRNQPRNQFKNRRSASPEAFLDLNSVLIPVTV